MNAEEAMETIFQKLTMWRNLPKYQLERRADIFFSLYLKEILEAKLNKNTGGDAQPVRLRSMIIPEFPIKQEGNHTVNVDYVMFDDDLKTIYLIEFKTDIGSRRDDQDDYLIKAVEIINKEGFGTIVSELWNDVFQATSDKSKYFHFFQHLKELGIIDITTQIEKIIFSDRQQGINKEIKENAATLIRFNNMKARIVFVQPEPVSKTSKKAKKELPDDTIEVTFNDIYNVLSEIKSSFAQMFAQYVKAWSPINENDKTYLAGARSPEVIAAELKQLIQVKI